MGNEVSSSQRRFNSSSRKSANKRLSIEDSSALSFLDNLCGAVSGSSDSYTKDRKRGGSSSSSKHPSTTSRSSSSRNTNNTHGYDENRSNSRKYSLPNNNNSSSSGGGGGRRPRNSYDDDTESEMAESEVGMDEFDEEDTTQTNDNEYDEGQEDDEETDADTMVTDASEPVGASTTKTKVAAAAVPPPHAKPLASSFAKKCYFTKAGIGKTTQHYEGLIINGGPTVLMLASAMKLKGCPTICDEDLRRVEQSYPNQFSRLPDELMLSSGWRRISKYCHFSHKPIPDGVPFFHSKQKLHPNGGYYFLLASAIGMISPTEVEPLTRDHLVVLETDFPTQCDAAPLPLIQNPNLWTLVTKFCFFSGGPINTDEDVYYEADFIDRTIYMLAFLSPALTPEELYLMDNATGTNNNNNQQNHPIRMSVDAVRDVESVYDLMDRDFEDLKLYHLGPCRALPPHLLQPASWRKVLPEHFCHIRDLAMERAKAFEERFGKINYTPYPQHHPQQHDTTTTNTNNSSNNAMPIVDNSVPYTFMDQHHPQPQQLPPNISSTVAAASPILQHQHPYPPQMPFYSNTATTATPPPPPAVTATTTNSPFGVSKEAPYYTQPYMPYTTATTTTTGQNPHESPMLTAAEVAEIYPRPHDEVDGMKDLQDEIENMDRSGKVSVISFGGDVDVEAPMRITTSDNDEIRMKAPSSDAGNDKGDIPLTSAAYTKTEDDRGKMSSSFSISSKPHNEYNSPQRKSTSDPWNKALLAQRNDGSGDQRTNSRYNEDENMHLPKQGNSSTILKRFEDEEETSPTRHDSRHTGRLYSDGMEREGIKSPTAKSQDHSYTDSKRRPIIGLNKSPARKVDSPQLQKNKEGSDNIRSTAVNYDEDASHGMGENKKYQSRVRNASPARASGSPHLLQKNKEDRDNIRSTVVNYDDDASHGMGETKINQSRMRNASPARASGSPHLLQKSKEGSEPVRSTAVNYDEDVSYGMGETKIYQSGRGNAIVPNEDSYDDSELMRSASSLQNDENDETHFHGNRRDRTILEDEYSVGRTRVRAVGHRNLRSSSLSTRLRKQPQELEIKKPLHESKHVTAKALSSNNYDSPPATISPPPKVPMSLKAKNDDASVVSTKSFKALQETKVVSSRLSSSIAVDTAVTGLPSSKVSLSHEPKNDEGSVASAKYSKPLNDSKGISSRVLSSYNYVSSAGSSKVSSFPESKIKTDSKFSSSKVDLATPRPSHESSSKNDDSPIQSSPDTTTTSEADRSTRRALILKMAKARMQKHKRDLSEPPILNKNSGSMQINLDLD